MSKASVITKKIDKALVKLNPFSGLVYKRFITNVGGDTVTGRGSTVEIVDVLITVTPIFRAATFNNATLRSSKYGNNQALVDPFTSSSLVDLVMTASSSAVSLSELNDPNMTIVAKRVNVEEEYLVSSYESTSIYGEDVMFDVIIRSKKRVATS